MGNKCVEYSESTSYASIIQAL